MDPPALPALRLVDDSSPHRAAATPPSGTGEAQSSRQIELPALPVLGVTPAPVKARGLWPLWAGGAALVLVAALGAGWWWRTPLGTREIVERNEASVALIQGQAESGTGFLVRKNLLASKRPRPEAEALGWPPRGGRPRVVAPVGGMASKQSKRSQSQRHGPIPRPHNCGSSVSNRKSSKAVATMGKARRIAGSSSGHTARGRGFSTY